MKIAISLLLACLLLCLPHAVGAAGAAPLSAYESVQQSTDELLARLREVQPVYEQDPERFFSEVEAALSPYIDFEGFSKRVMARHYRQATETQQQAFEVKFREALIRTYATALLEFDNQRVEVKAPTRPEKSPERATIELEVHARSGAVYPVQYQLGLEQDRWLLRNVVINGINIGLQFRTQFDAYMQKHRGDIDEVIANWAVDSEN
jgi:phospholipid transport system substrate-binding protein